MSIKLISDVWEHSRQNGTALLLLLAIADYANQDNEAWPKVENLAKKARLSVRQTQRLIQSLIDQGELALDATKTGRGNAVIFKVLLPELKGDIQGGETERVTSTVIKGDIQGNKNAERVTSRAIKGDIQGQKIAASNTAIGDSPSDPIRDPFKEILRESCQDGAFAPTEVSATPQPPELEIAEGNLPCIVKDKATFSDVMAIPTNATPRRAAEAREVFDYWVKALGKNPDTCKFTKDREAKVKARLNEGYTVDRIKTAIEGIKLSAWHMGENPKGNLYNDLVKVCESGSVLEGFEARVVRSVKQDSVNRTPSRPFRLKVG